MVLLSQGLTIEHLLKYEWRVPSSQKEGGVYRIRRGRREWSCTCRDYRMRGLSCKHIHAVRFDIASGKGEPLVPINKAPLRKAPKRTIPQTESKVKKPKCPHCEGLLVIRYGRPNRKQAWWCRDCLRKFIPEDGFKRLKGNAQTITLALDLYFKGLSLRQITDTLVQFYNIQVSHVTVYRWLKRFVDILTEFSRALRPAVGDKWNCDEMKVKYGSNWKWLWHIVDRETRYLLVSYASSGLDLTDARVVFAAARGLAEKRPQEIVTDGLPTYIKAWKQELRIPEGGRRSRNTHVRDIHFADHSRNNNVVERLNGTVRDRHKAVRGLKKADGPLTKGQAVYYNLIKPHLGLNGLTPAEAAGLAVPSAGNRWLGLIEASQSVVSVSTGDGG